MGTSGLAGRDRLPATRPGVELTLVWTFLGIRAVALAQATLALAAGGLSKSANPALSVVLLIAVAVDTALLGRWLIRRRSMLPFSWPIGIDFGLSVCVIAASAAYITPAGRIDTWTMWAYPVTLTTGLLAAGALARLRWVMLVSGMLAVTYAAVVAIPLLNDVTGRVTAVVNAIAFPGFAAVAFLFASLVRGLASAADMARARVSELEQDRSRALIHDLLVYLRLDRFAEADDQTRAVMIAQAQAKHEQMRSYVDGTGSTRNFQARMSAVLALHPALPISSTIDVGPELALPEDTLDQLELALDTALANVEQHAAGSSVVLSVRSEHDHIAVTVRDDGPGFDSAISPHGFGISEILGRQLSGVGGRGVVESSPGGGTLVRIVIPTEQT